MAEYYVDTGDGKDGPLDLLAIMRRVRARKITRSTLIYVNDATLPFPARAIADIAPFFDKPSPTHRDNAPPNMLSLFRDGWRFTRDNPALIALAGCLLMVCAMAAYALVQAHGFFTGAMLGLIVFMMLHSIFLAVALRLYRRQGLGEEFVAQQLWPVIGFFLFSSLLLGLMTAGGLLLFVLPGLYVAVVYFFVPFLILDHRYDVVDAMHASRVLLLQHAKHYLLPIVILVLLHLVCLLLVVPALLTLPLFAAIASELYEELSSS